MDWQTIADTPLQSSEDMRRQITDRAISDDEFRSLLLSDPKAAISQELGMDMPDDIEVVVHQNSPQTLHLSLPVTDISEDQLEQIAAGRCCC